MNARLKSHALICPSNSIGRKSLPSKGLRLAGRGKTYAKEYYVLPKVFP